MRRWRRRRRRRWRRATPAATRGGRACLDDNVSLLLLGLDVRREVRLARVDRRLHVLHRRAALGDVALRLPRKLDLVGDVEVDGQVERVAHAIVVERVQALEDDDRRRRHLLDRVELAGDVVVDGLRDRLAGLQVGDVRRHLVPVLARLVQRGDAIGPLRVALAARAVPLVVVVQADDRGHVRDERVGLAADRQALRLAAEDGGEAAHEGRLAAARVGGDADDDRRVEHLHLRLLASQEARRRQARGRGKAQRAGEHDGVDHRGRPEQGRGAGRSARVGDGREQCGAGRERRPRRTHRDAAGALGLKLAPSEDRLIPPDETLRADLPSSYKQLATSLEV